VIYEFGRDIEAALRARKFPIRVEYGPDRSNVAGFPSLRVLLQRDRTQSDAFDPAKGAQRNPHKRGVRSLSTVFTIYASSSLRGAHVGDHERLCEQVVDALWIAILEWGVATQAGFIPVLSGGYASAQKLETGEVWPGVVYELRIRVPRGVNVLDYKGAAEPEHAVIGFTNAARVRHDQATTDEDFESVEIP
jgi:hypothetical protein